MLTVAPVSIHDICKPSDNRVVCEFNDWAKADPKTSKKPTWHGADTIRSQLLPDGRSLNHELVAAGMA